MKKLLHFNKILFIMLLVGISSTGWTQILYEGFNYPTPAFIGGNGDPGATSNNWVTHSVTAGETTTIDIENGNLTFPGLASSTGNKVFPYSNANKTSRDVNRTFTSTATTLYYSVLVNIIDNSQINTLDNYFMHFGATAGAANTTLGGRLGVRSVGTPTTNFRFVIANTSGGTPVYSDNGADLNFGTSYLVVVKYNISAALTVATMWVNPTSIGGAEPTGGISNSTGTNAITTFASICLRNNATTPKAYIDEIRVGETWASVTPAGITFPKLVITEIMYNSPESTDEEWFELYNSGSFAVDMTGFFMVDNDTAHFRVPMVFPAGSIIAAGKYFTAKMSSGGAFPFTPDAVLTGGALGVPFNLGNTSDQVKIYTKEKQLIDSVQYFDNSPWPTVADGGGPSLTLCDPTKDNSLVANWSASTESLPGTTIKATPGKGCAITSVPTKMQNDLTIYPNPTNDRIYTDNPANELFDITILSSLGKPVKSVQSKQAVISLDLSELPKGLYVVKLTNRAGKISKVCKIILK